MTNTMRQTPSFTRETLASADTILGVLLLEVCNLGIQTLDQLPQVISATGTHGVGEG